jgi:hypothetical protein
MFFNKYFGNCRQTQRDRSAHYNVIFQKLLFHVSALSGRVKTQLFLRNVNVKIYLSNI